MKADAAWDARTDPAQQRGAHAARWRRRNRRDDRRPSPRARSRCRSAALDAVKETLREAGGDAAPGEAGGEVSFVRARMANEVLKAQTARVRLQKMKGELVDRARAATTVFDLARRERDAWQNWPARVAALMAAELGRRGARDGAGARRTTCGSTSAKLAEVKVELR